MLSTSEIRQLIEKAAPKPEREPLTVITVRLPKSLHAALHEIRHRKRVSLNGLCVDALAAQALEALALLEADCQHPDGVE